MGVKVSHTLPAHLKSITLSWKMPYLCYYWVNVFCHDSNNGCLTFLNNHHKNINFWFVKYFNRGIYYHGNFTESILKMKLKISRYYLSPFSNAILFQKTDDRRKTTFVPLSEKVHKYSLKTMHPSSMCIIIMANRD